MIAREIGWIARPWIAREPDRENRSRFETRAACASRERALSFRWMSTRPIANEDAGESVVPEVGPGSRLGRYELLASLGAGGMGQVWLAEQSGDVGFRKLVALKVILPEQAGSGSVRRMFLDEASIASRIRHANVVEVLDLGEQGERLYQAMTFIEGASLGALLRARGAAPSGVAVRVLVDALRGLHAAHELRDDDGVRLNLVHRDVSPQNILIGLDGVAKIADFGVAKALGRLTETTQAGRWKGKLRYVAPEQLDGKPATIHGDIFSAGVVLWEALTGIALFSTADRFEKETRARNAREVAPNVPMPLAAVAARALELSPAARFATAHEMADALEAAAREAGCAANHSDVAALVEASMAPSLAAYRDVVRARRRGEPLPVARLPHGTLPSAALTGLALQAKRAWPRLAVMALVGFVAATSAGGVVLGSRSPRPSAPPIAIALAPPAAALPAPVRPQEPPVADIPHLDSPTLLPRVREPRDRPQAASTWRKKERPAAGKPVPAHGAPSPARPTFDNPY
jgi:eukaryotic-like serine/threonine-protein kinase